MVAFAVVIVLAQRDFAADLEAALQSVKLQGTQFHRALILTGKKHDLYVDTKQSVIRTVGDKRGVILWTENGFMGPGQLYFIWPEGGRNRVQHLDRKNDMGWTSADFYWRGDTIRAAGVGYSGGNWTWPTLYVFRKGPTGWKAKQVINEEAELSGGCSFVRSNGRVDPNHARARVRLYPKHLGSPHAGPHLLYVYDWRFSSGRFKLTSKVRQPTAFAELDDLAGLVRHKQRKTFEGRVPGALGRKLWRVLYEAREGYYLNVDDVGNLTNDLAKAFVISEKWKVSFQGRPGRWRVRSVTRLE
ncbi:MAG: hypothetical protein HZC36_10250 [Armatimonadetes bacterium]|nr:hypothetical protein [Armatimonadota bacterium]